MRGLTLFVSTCCLGFSPSCAKRAVQCSSAVDCATTTATSSSAAAARPSVSANDAPSASANETSVVDSPSPREVVGLWNAAHATREPSAFARLYGDEVTYYGRELSRDSSVESKQRALAKAPDFEQTLVGEMSLTKVSETRMRATFIKAVTASGKTTRYPAYLELTPSPNGWVINAEGDEVTDANLKRRVVKGGDLVGDWDGDGKPDTLRLIPPKFKTGDSPEDNFGECDGPCNCTLVFAQHQPVVIENCIGGTPVNEGDLDGQPGEEFGILPDWWTSCWRDYHVFGFRAGAWTRVVDPIATHCTQWEQGVDAIEKDPVHPGHVLVRSTNVEDFGITTQSVPVR